MTVAQQSGVTTIAGNGAMTQFVYGFIAVAPTYLSVLYTDPAGIQTELELGPGPGQFQVTMNLPLPGAIWGVGGVVTYAPNGVPIPLGSTLTIMRTLPVAQPVSLANLGSLETLGAGAEAGDDLIVLLLQQYTDALARALRMNPANLAPPLDLPPAAQIAGQLAAFDPTGNNMIAVKILPQGMVSSIMQPVVAAASLQLARAALGVPGAISGQFFPTAGAYTYVAPPSLLWAIVECVGSGGGGGDVAAAPGLVLAGGGGGSGGYSRSLLSTVQIGLSQPVLVGFSGAATSFGGLVVANGGQVGQANDGVTVFGNPGLGAVPGLGDLALAGEAGGPGLVNPMTGPNGPVLTAAGGHGGSMWGGGATWALVGGGTGAAGANGLFGGGGSGAACSNPLGSALLGGGTGGTGWVFVTEFSA